MINIEQALRKAGSRIERKIPVSNLGAAAYLISCNWYKTHKIDAVVQRTLRD